MEDVASITQMYCYKHTDNYYLILTLLTLLVTFVPYS